MLKFSTLLIATTLLPTAVAAEPASGKSGSEIIEAVASDEAKVKAYCAMIATIANASEDEKTAEAETVMIDAYLKKLGPEFEAVFQDDANIEAVSKLDEKCG